MKVLVKSRFRNHIAVLVSVAFIATACGARVAPYLGATTAGVPNGNSNGSQSNGSQTAPNVGSNQPVAGGVTSTTLGSTGSSGQAQPGQASTSPGTSKTGAGPAVSSGPGRVTVSSLTPANFSYDPQTQASYCTGTTGNTASAPGVTPTAITAGNVSGITGAVSDSFNPGYQAVQAVFDSINRFGGICGRQLKLDVQDDQQSSSSNNADVEALLPKVLAFVGSLSDADNGGVPAMVAAGSPDLGPAINSNRSNSSVYWSATGGSVTVRNGHALVNDNWINGLKQHGMLPKNIAVLSYSIPISAQAGQEYATLFQDLGVSICYSNYSIPPAPGTVMGSIVASMQQKGCQGVYTTMDVVGNADMLQDMSSDGYRPPLISTTYEGYSPQQISLAGSQNAQGLDIFLTSVPLSAPVAGVQEYSQQLSTYQPGQPLTEFGLEAWADAEIYVYGLLKAGRNPTRASLTSALAAVTNWTSDGAFGAYTPSNRTGAPCVTNVQWRGSKWAETWPSSGLYCTGQLVDVGPAQ